MTAARRLRNPRLSKTMINRYISQP